MDVVKILSDIRNLRTDIEGYEDVLAQYKRNLSEALGEITVLHFKYEDNIGVNGAKVLAKALENNTTLTTLRLDGNNIGDEGIKALAEVLKVNKTLTTLNLWGNRIGVEGIEALAKALENNTTLTTLDLGNNDIGVDGAKVLAKALENNTTLTTLRLRAGNIGNDGVGFIVEALKKNKNLIKGDWPAGALPRLIANNLTEANRVTDNLIAIFSKEPFIPSTELLLELLPRISAVKELLHERSRDDVFKKIEAFVIKKSQIEISEASQLSESMLEIAIKNLKRGSVQPVGVVPLDPDQKRPRLT